MRDRGIPARALCSLCLGAESAVSGINGREGGGRRASTTSFDKSSPSCNSYTTHMYICPHVVCVFGATIHTHLDIHCLPYVGSLKNPRIFKSVMNILIAGKLPSPIALVLL